MGVKLGLIRPQLEAILFALLILEGKKRKNAAEQVNILEYGALDFAQEIAALDVNAMTPMDALNKLYTLREKARNL